MAQPVDLLAKPLEHRVNGRAQLCLVAEIARVGQPQTQSTKALDGFVMDLPGPACALTLARLHAKTQSLDLDRALGHEPLCDAGRESVERAPVGVAEATVLAGGDHQPAALALQAEGLDQHRPSFEPELVQPGRFLAAGPIQRKRLAGHVKGAKRAALHR